MRGRKRGSEQKRNESKYWLPNGVSLLPENPTKYNKETKLKFLDNKYGEFISDFKAIQGANASTHPKSIKERRNATNLVKYGNINAGATKEARLKAKTTMLNKYGVEHALQSKLFLEKSQNTLKTNYGVKTPLENPEILKIVRDKMNDSSFISKEQQEISDFIRSLGFNCGTRFIGGARPFELDIKIENTNLAIEYNGLYWHSSDKKGTMYHLEKTKAANAAGIQLIHIFEHLWYEKKDIVKNIIKSKLGINTKIYARNCVLKMVNTFDARDFLNKYHLNGYSNQTFTALGLYYDNDLVAIATLGKHHRNNSEIVLNRFCVKGGISVVGGLSKLIKNLNKEWPIMTTFIDLTYATSESWLKCGWKQLSVSRPDYFYFSLKNKQIYSKQSLKKSKYNNYHNGLTELEYAISIHWSRVYDCGKVKLIYTSV